ncbi:hypothetical protein RFI36_02785 [Acinetobacter gerneri]|uniref:Outer membrane protein beta-barrel domain-containing protein n=1 Tax=Acinetobacter gerneri TaxID=202952 RepID=A0AAW8JDG7_9GAMM|nr:hypothetical protein [Acinetobacter gerneri]MDQ9008680.1 hypothetical protein [Acinetobacter gerneri]MDQ9012772.1 hypothetical protein [Acinetobacter gerneri]MDQ9024219.1 hypothetical protein [Acinetobacter gerneri]MDQ9051456.1 hypothetical protein [Acinetobacter gerneri]MDQ9058679.1 hypothetical protein [Acinetobacter gerneri]
MKKLSPKLCSLLGLALLSSAAYSEDIHGYIGTYIVPQAGIKIKNPGAERIKDSGRAYGAVAEISKNQWFGFVHYETVSVDIKALPQPGVDGEEFRAGVGWRQKIGRGSVQADVEYFKQKQEYDFVMIPTWKDDGVAMHVGGEYLLGVIGGQVPVVGFADFGYFDLDKSDATEYRFGLKMMLTKNVGLMSAYRIFKQEKDQSNEKTTLKAMNIGLSYVF